MRQTQMRRSSLEHGTRQGMARSLALPIMTRCWQVGNVGRRARLQVQALATSSGSDGQPCPLFVDKDGDIIPAMCADYGFRAGAGRLYQEHYGEVPNSVWQLARENYKHELMQLRRSVRYNELLEEVERRPPSNLTAKALYAFTGAMVAVFGSLDRALEGAGLLSKLEPPPTLSALETQEFKEIRAKLDKLVLHTDRVVAMEEARVAKTGDMTSPLWVKVPFLALCWVLDVLYDNRPIQKFWVLETVARIPYFAYISILHLYESLGFWRAGAELRKIHFAEEWNEMHHLQIMESLGGDRHWFDRFIAEHAAVLYYWMLLAFYLQSPKMAYNFMQRVELHAADTYCAFVEENRELLASIPAPYVALNYYLSADLYLFDSFQTASKGAVEPRRPACNNLLDVFENIRDDEFEHVKTMVACQEETIAKDIAAAQAAQQERASRVGAVPASADGLPALPRGSGVAGARARPGQAPPATPGASQRGALTSGGDAPGSTRP